MTQTHPNPNLILQKSPVYDVANSLLILRVYFKYSWAGLDGKPNNTMPYYLKFIKESVYDGYGTEFARAFQRLMEIERSNNPFKTAILYQNHNKGRFVQGVQNPQVFKIVDSKGLLHLTYRPDITDDVKDYIESSFEILKNVYHGKI